MKINIPRLQSEHIVAKDITVTVEGESRNIKFLDKRGVLPVNTTGYGFSRVLHCKKCNLIQYQYRCSVCNGDIFLDFAKFQITIPAGSKLFIDRYYIRNGSPEFDSVSFRYHNGKEKSRFWIKLSDAEQIEFV